MTEKEILALEVKDYNLHIVDSNGNKIEKGMSKEDAIEVKVGTFFEYKVRYENYQTFQKDVFCNIHENGDECIELVRKSLHSFTIQAKQKGTALISVYVPGNISETERFVGTVGFWFVKVVD